MKMQFVGAALAATALVSACSLGASPDSNGLLPTTRVTPTARPNIIFVLTDDLTWNLVRFMPNVRQMQKSGATFSHYYVTDSLCCPSRTSIFTGELPHNTGVFTNGGADGGFAAFLAHHDETSTFNLSLRASGYQTALMGKFLNRYNPHHTVRGQQPYVAPGWSAWDVAGVRGYHELGYTLAQGHTNVSYSTQPGDYLTDVLSTKAQEFVNQSAQAHKPFMLEVSTFAPHDPFVPAPRDATKFPDVTAPRSPAFGHPVSHAPRWLAQIPPLNSSDRAKFNLFYKKRAEAVQAVDRMIGQLESEIATLGLTRNTYFVFSSDNGYHLGEHDLRPGKQTAFDTDIRVPLIVTGPGVPAGGIVDDMTQNIDLAPTFDRLAGVTPPSSVDGRSLLPLLHARPQPDWRHAVLVEHHGPTTDVKDPDFTNDLAGNPPSYEALRTPTALYVEYVTGEREYYDTRVDPQELDNAIATLSPTQRADYHRALVEMERCHGQTSCWAAQHLPQATLSARR